MTSRTAAPATVDTVMTREPVALSWGTPVVEAARAMREQGIGDVVVLKDGALAGILTDRDIVVRGIAEGREPQSTAIGEICSRELTTVTPSTRLDDAVRLMKEKAVRRLPVVEHGKAIGIVSLGDLALKQDRRSALGEISAARPNR